MYTGEIENTNFGKVLFDADMMLKRFMLGYDENQDLVTSSVAGYQSVTHRFADLDIDYPDKAFYSRYWISPQEITLKESTSTDAFIFEDVILQVQTESLIGDPDQAWIEASEDFVEHHTEHFDEFAEEVPSYAKTKQLAKIVGVVKWIKDNGIGIDFEWAKNYGPLATTTPATKLMIESPEFEGPDYIYFDGFVFGGINYDTSNTYETDTHGTSTRLQIDSEAAATSSTNDISWTFDSNGETYEAVSVSAEIFKSAGAYTHSAEDMSAPTASPLPLELNRSYSSFAVGSDVGFGPGWDFFPASMDNLHPGLTTTCNYWGIFNVKVPNKIALVTSDNGRETFTFSCPSTAPNPGYIPDDSRYLSSVIPLPGGSNRLVFDVQTRKINEYKFYADSATSTDFKLTTYDDIRTNPSPGGNDDYVRKYKWNVGTTTLLTIQDVIETVNASTTFNGQNIAFNYNGNGQISSVVGPRGTTTYKYDSNGDLVKVIDMKGSTTTYLYGDQHLLESITDRSGTTFVENQYDALGRVATQTDASNLAKSVNYDDEDLEITWSDTNGRNGASIFDEEGRIIKEINALMATTTYIYTATTTDAPTAVINAHGATTTFTYDEWGDLTSTTDSEGNSTTYTRGGFGETEEIIADKYTSILGSPRVSAYEYDIYSMNVSQSVIEGQGTTTYTYTKKGQLASTTDSNGDTEHYYYDSKGSLILYKDKLGNETSYSYDNAGYLAEVVDASGATTTYSYDDNGNRLFTSNAVSTVGYAYDVNDRLIAVVDPNNATTTFTYNRIGLLATTTNPLGASTHYYYDKYKNLTKVTDALSRDIEYSYDALNREVSQELASGKTYTTEYDLLGNPIVIDEPNGVVATSTYDSLNRLTSSVINGETHTYTYDDAGRLAAMRNNTGTTTYSYDARDRVTQVENPYGATVQYEHDDLGNITLITYPDTKTIENEFDDSSRLIQQTDWNNDVTTYTYNELGSLSTTTLPNGITIKRTYDNVGRLSSITHRNVSNTILFREIYTRDDKGNLLEIDENGSAVATDETIYDFDLADRIINVESSLVNEIYEYDDVGNLIELDDSSGITTFTHNVDNELSSTSESVGEEFGFLMGEFSFPAFMSEALAYVAETPLKLVTNVYEFAIATTESLLNDENGNIKITSSDSANLESETIVVSSSSLTIANQIDNESGMVLGTTTQTSTPTFSGVVSVSTSTPISKVASSTDETEITDVQLLEEVLLPENATSTVQNQEKPQEFSDIQNARISNELKNKNHKEKANIKGNEMAKIATPLQAYFSEMNVEVEIQKIEPIEDGVQVFVKGWKDGKALGFGDDGSVEIERIKIINPPILVRQNGELVEDLEAALKESVSHTVAVIGKEDSEIEIGKVGNTTTTVYPAAGATSPVDGYIRRNLTIGFGEVWSTIRTGSGLLKGVSDTTQTYFRNLTDNSSTKWRVIQRAMFLFDTSSIPDSDVISSATVSLYGTGKVNNIGATANQSNLHIVSSTPGSTSDLTASSDYNNLGSVDYGSIAYANFSTSSYSNIALNASGTSAITKTGITKFGTKSGADLDNDQPTWGNAVEVSMDGYFADQSGTTNDPKLIVQHGTAPVAPHTLKVEGLTNPTAITDYSPEFTAKFNDANAGDYAQSYKIQVGTSSSIWTSLKWDSAKTALSSTTGIGITSPEISYGGSTLSASTTYYWRIKFWDNLDFEGAWSTTTASFKIANGTSSTSSAEVNYIYDDSGNLISAISDSLTKLFTWNPLGLLSSASIDGILTYFSYDAEGNRIGKVTPGSGSGGNSIIFLDSFTEASDTYPSSHTPETGTGWTSIYTNGSASSNSVHIQASSDTLRGSANDSSAGVMYSANTTYGSPDYQVKFTMTSAPTLDEPLNVGLRMDSTAANGYLLEGWWADNHDPGIYKVSSGAFTQLALHDSSNGILFNNGDIVRAEVSGNDITMFDENDIGQVYVSDSTYTSANKAAIGFGGYRVGNDDISTTVPVVDNLEVIQLPTATGWNSPSTSGETHNNWTNPTNAYSSNNTRSTIAADTYVGTGAQDYGDFGFAIDSGDDILGIEVRVESLTDTSGYHDLAISVSQDNGSTWSSEKTIRYEDFDGVDGSKVAGHGLSLWGLSWDPPDLSNSNFRVKVRLAARESSAVDDLGIDQISVKVFHTESLGSATSTVRYVNDVLAPNALVLAETDEENTLTRYNVWGPNGLVSTGEASDSDRYYPITDHHGSVRLLTDSSGNIVNSYTYTPYGQVTASSSTTSIPYLYTSEQFDEETGLVYLRARYYDPELGRFISRDPVRGTLDNPLSQHPYQYALDNPLMYSDPSGEVWQALLAGAALLYFTSADVESPCANSNPTNEDFEAVSKINTYLIAADVVFGGFAGIGKQLFKLTIKHDHTVKHLGGIAEETIDAAIKSDIAKHGLPDTIGEGLERLIFVDGHLLEYRIHRVSDNHVNVGTYFFLK